MSNQDIPTAMEQLAAEMYVQILAKFGEETQLTAANLFTFVRIAMETVEQVNGLPGKDKKALVIRLCQIAINRSVLYNNETLQYLVDNVLDNIIDEFVSIDLDGLHINEDQKSRIKAFLKKLCFCGSSSTPAPAPTPVPAPSPVTN